ncbi:MAG: tRNA pseudouridine(38-40) synthase TruA [SAR202 cluster bacterium]|nr:tRNA pseudouridine(38-40) synthase TruA [SAR202 cluster bacterium]
MDAPRANGGAGSRPADARRDATARRIALVLEYEGTAYAGSQRQANGPSVQSVVEEALRTVTGSPVRLRMAGRTDAGVHALGQVAAFDTTSRLAAERFVRALNRYLPDDVSVVAAHEAPEGFDPRRHAVARVYRYTFWVAPARPALRRRFVYHVGRPLDTTRMAKALEYLRGNRDCAPFSGAVPAGSSTRRTLYCTAAWREGPEVLMELEGNAFLPQQVRRIAAAALQVGLGKLTLGQFQALADSPVRGAASQVLPPQGLCLRAVKYRVPPWGTRDGESASKGRRPENHATDSRNEAHRA